jgi:hypothetical protein
VSGDEAAAGASHSTTSIAAPISKRKSGSGVWSDEQV